MQMTEAEKKSLAREVEQSKETIRALENDIKSQLKTDKFAAFFRFFFLSFISFSSKLQVCLLPLTLFSCISFSSTLTSLPYCASSFYLWRLSAHTEKSAFRFFLLSFISLTSHLQVGLLLNLFCICHLSKLETDQFFFYFFFFIFHFFQLFCLSFLWARNWQVLLPFRFICASYIVLLSWLGLFFPIYRIIKIAVQANYYGTSLGLPTLSEWAGDSRNSSQSPARGC